MKKAVGYFRVSTEKEEQKQSLENQKSLFLNFIKDNGYEFQGFYVDDKTGTIGKRKNFIKMLDDAEKGLFDIIIVKDLSRLARNQELATKVKRIMESRDVRILSIDNRVDTFDDDKNRTYGLFAWVYQEEAESTSRRIKDSFKTKQLNGEFLGSNPPYGYNKVDKKLVPRDDETVENVKFIFNKYLEDWGFKRIAQYLTDNEYPTPSQVAEKSNAGLYWFGSTVKKILSNPHYTGHLVQHRETTRSVVNKNRKQVPKDEQVWVYNTHEALIDETTFNLVQRKLDANKKKGKGKGTRKKQNLHLFTGMAFCADCGKAMRYRKNINSYVCSAYHNHGAKACTSHQINEDRLIAIIKKDLKKFINVDINYLNIEKQIAKETAKEKKSIIKLENQLKDYVKKNKIYLDKLIDEKITETEYQNYKHLNNLEMKRIQEEINRLASKQSGKKPDVSAIRSELVKIVNLEVLDRELLNMLIDRIEIKETGELKVFYTFASPVTEYNYETLKSS